MAGVGYGGAYCGAPPIPGTLTDRFNLDPVLIVALVAIAVLHVAASRRAAQPVASVVAGWAIAAAALVSPLCALSVSLFAARVAQHMILLLAAAPLIAASFPQWRAIKRPAFLWSATIAFFTRFSRPTSEGASWRGVP